MPHPVRPIPLTVQWLFQAKDLRYRHVFGLFFTHPKLACGLFSLRPFWWQTLLLGLLFCVIGSFLLTMNEAPEYGKDIRQGTDFILDTLSSVELSNGVLCWAEECNEVLPASTSLEHCQFDIIESWNDFQPARRIPFHLGFVLSHEGLGLWAQETDGTTSVQKLILPAKHIPQSQERLVLNDDTRAFFCRFGFWVLFGSFLMSNGFLLLESLCTTALVLCIVWIFLGRVRKFRMVPCFLAMGFNLAMPPFLVALLWQLSGIPGGFENLFCITFLLFLIYASIEGRHGRFFPA